MSDSASRLPARPSLEQLRKQAKERAGANSITLAEAQHALAREHGFENWAALVHHVEATHPAGLTKFEGLAETVARAYMDGDASTIRELNWTNSTSFVWDFDAERMRKRLDGWYASTSRSIDLAIADARHLVARQAGADNWDELVANLARQSSAPGVGSSAVATPLYKIDDERRSISVQGALTEKDWDVVFGVMKERELTELKGAGQITDTALERLGRLRHVTSLDLSFAKRLTHSGLRHIASLPLRSLELGGWGTQVDDACLEVLGHLTELRGVSFVWARRVTDAGVANLAGCTHLETVNLLGTPTGDGALRALTGKSRLGALDAGLLVSPAGLSTLRDFPVFSQPLPEEIVRAARTSDGSPTHLLLNPSSFAHGGLDALAALDGLYSLRLWSTDRSIAPITGPALRPVLQMRGLESLWCDPSNDAMAVIGTMPQLRKLMCQDTKAGDDGWVGLSRSPSIEHLWGGRNSGLNARGLVAMSSMPALRILGVNLGRVDAAGLASLSSFPALRDLTPIGLDDAAFEHVGRCARLETLTCMYTKDIGDAAMEHVAGLQRLRTFYAGDTSIGDRSLAILGALPELERVELWSCTAITNDGLGALAAAPRLREVIVEGSPRITRNAAALFPRHVTVRLTG